MCLIAFAYRMHPRYQLVLIANRDEFFDRPTREAHWWDDRPGILGGRDLQSGGTWLGVTRGGRWAAVTNFREGRAEPAPRSRGELTADFLAQDTDSFTYCRELSSRTDDYNGFNLLAASADHLCYCTNRAPGVRILEPGIYTLSNHLLDTPWPKAELARRDLRALVELPDLPEPSSLLALLSSGEAFPDHMLPDTGVELTLERTLSSQFIVSDSYGTRCTSVLLIGTDGGKTLVEQNYLRGEPLGPMLSYSF